MLQYWVRVGLRRLLPAVGGLLGATWATRLVKRWGAGRVIVVSALISGPTLLPWVFVQPGWSVVWAAAAMVMGSFCVVVYNVAQVSARVRLCPDQMIGRMTATMRFVLAGVMPLGALGGGVLAEHIGIRPTFLIVAVAQSLAFLWVLTPAVRTLPAPTSDADDD